MDHVAREFSVIHRRMASNIDKALKKLDIPYGQFMFILCICENAGLSQEKLSCELQMDKGFVARTVKCLEEKGFVRRSPSPDDRRQNQLFPTEKAERAYPEIIETLREQEQKVIGDLSESEAYLLRVLLGKILKNL